MTAMEKTHSMDGPVAQAIAHEAVRLAADERTLSLGPGSVRQATTSDSDWLRVRQLAPGTEIVVTVRGSQPGKRTFASANASELTVMTPNDPRSTTKIARPDIVEIKGPVRTRGWGGGVLGATGGAALGLAIGWSLVHNSGREEYGALFWSPLVGGVAGGFVGSHALRSTTADVLYRAP